MMRARRAGSALAAILALSACSRAPTGGFPASALDSAIGAAIGDPTTCVLVADAAGKAVYTYGDRFNCVRALPACDRPGMLSARQALSLATSPPRGASCSSNVDGSRRVGWAEGIVYGKGGQFNYSAVMEGQTALPGIEMNARLTNVFEGVGLKTK